MFPREVSAYVHYDGRMLRAVWFTVAPTSVSISGRMDKSMPTWSYNRIHAAVKRIWTGTTHKLVSSSLRGAHIDGSWGSVVAQLVKNPPAKQETWVGKIPGEGEGYPLQHSGLEKSMDCIVHGVTKSQTRLRGFHVRGQGGGYDREEVGELWGC